MQEKDKPLATTTGLPIDAFDNDRICKIFATGHKPLMNKTHLVCDVDGDLPQGYWDEREGHQEEMRSAGEPVGVHRE